MDEELELIRRVRSGDKVAYAELLRPLLGAATRLAFGMLQDRCAAEDSVQDAAIRAWSRFENLEAGRSFRPWFFAIVTNCCRDALRSRWRWRAIAETGLAVGEALRMEEEWLAGADLRRALAALPHGQRAAIVLHFYLDLPLEEVAATLGLRIAGVKARINRGLRRLRQSLESDGVVTA